MNEMLNLPGSVSWVRVWLHRRRRRVWCCRRAICRHGGTDQSGARWAVGFRDDPASPSPSGSTRYSRPVTWSRIDKNATQELLEGAYHKTKGPTLVRDVIGVMFPYSFPWGMGFRQLSRDGWLVPAKNLFFAFLFNDSCKNCSFQTRR